MKRILKYVFVLVLALVTITGCGEKKNASNNLDLSAEKIIEKLYEGIDDMPMVANIELDKDNIEYYIGTNKVDFKEAVASEPLMGSIAHSVVVVKLNDASKAEEAKKLIKDNVDPAKWICVDAEIVTVDSIGDTVLLIMMDEENESIAKAVQANFDKLK